MKSKIAVVGKGNAGSAIGRGLERAGYEARLVGNDPQRIREVAAWGKVIILSVPYPAKAGTYHACLVILDPGDSRFDPLQMMLYP
jgi:predicted dinucleotide-binding enzyme